MRIQASPMPYPASTQRFGVLSDDAIAYFRAARLRRMQEQAVLEIETALMQFAPVRYYRYPAIENMRYSHNTCYGTVPSQRVIETLLEDDQLTLRPGATPRHVLTALNYTASHYSSFQTKDPPTVMVDESQAAEDMARRLLNVVFSGNLQFSPQDILTGFFTAEHGSLTPESAHWILALAASDDRQLPPDVELALVDADSGMPEQDLITQWCR